MLLYFIDIVKNQHEKEEATSFVKNRIDKNVAEISGFLVNL